MALTPVNLNIKDASGLLVPQKQYTDGSTNFGASLICNTEGVPNSPVAPIFTSETFQENRITKIFSVISIPNVSATAEQIINFNLLSDSLVPVVAIVGSAFYTIPNGKNLLIQSITATTRNITATINGFALRVRINENSSEFVLGAAISPLIPEIITLAAGTATATINNCNSGTYTIPEGLLIKGNGLNSIGISVIGTISTTGSHSFTMHAIEF